MSQRERERMVVLSQVQARKLRLAEAADLLEVSYRQVKRLWSRYRQKGDAGLMHGLRGRRGNAAGRGEALRTQVVAAYRREYQGFGPTLAAEQLQERQGLRVDHERLRRWLTAEGLWRVRRDRRRRHRRWRPRQAHAGQMVQFDGSDHAWFGPAQPRCTLMVMVDDATGWTYGQFHRGETSAAALATLAGYIAQRGLPRSLYLDQYSAYRVNGHAADEAEQRGQKRPVTQLGQVAAELGIELIHAHSPQAKGRVERMNGTLQDRLVKLLALEGIADLAAANRYLQQRFLPAHNARFMVAASQEADLHRAAPPAAELDHLLTLREDRVVGQDYCLSYHGRWLQLTGTDANRGLCGRKVQLRQHLDGRLTLHARGRLLAWQELPQRPQVLRPRPALLERVAGHPPRRRPDPQHPWRQPWTPAAARSAGAGSAAAALAPLAAPTLRRPPRRGQFYRVETGDTSI